MPDVTLPTRTTPAIVVFTSLFPHPGRPGAGLFIRERMFRVAAHLPLTVVSPQPWFPLQGLIRLLRPHFRPPAPYLHTQNGIEVYCPRFFSLPGGLKWLDGIAMARAARKLMRKLQHQSRVDIIDSHFAYPDGYAATRLGRWLRVPVSITLRGTEPRIATLPRLRERQRQALADADQIIGVSDSLRQLAVREGADPAHCVVVGNGVDTTRFHPVDRAAARAALGLADDAQVLISVGGLVERKGFHRVIDCLPALLARHPTLVYLVVGGPSPEGDISARLRAQVARLGLNAQVHFLGPRRPDELSALLSAADLFVLATSNEGWANVFLEAMACGLPVVTTDVGGNAEVVCRDDLGTVLPFGDSPALITAIDQGLDRPWDRAAILDYARSNSWDSRITQLLAIFEHLTGTAGAKGSDSA